MDSAIPIVTEISELLESQGFRLSNVDGDENSFCAVVWRNDRDESPESYFREAVSPVMAEHGYKSELQGDFKDDAEGITLCAIRQESISA